MPCSLRIQRRAYSLPLYSPFYIVKDCWGEPWIIPSYRIFDVHTVDQPQLCEELPCIPVGFMVTYGMAKFISYDGHMSWPHVLASDSGTKAVGLCSAAWGWQGSFAAWGHGTMGHCERLVQIYTCRGTPWDGDVCSQLYGSLPQC